MKALLVAGVIIVGGMFVPFGCADDEGDTLELGNPKVEAEWVKYRTEMCTALAEAEASGAALGLDRQAVIAMSIGMSDVDDPEIVRLITDLIERDC